MKEIFFFYKNIDLNANTGNIQNNQRKENFKNLIYDYELLKKNIQFFSFLDKYNDLIFIILLKGFLNFEVNTSWTNYLNDNQSLRSNIFFMLKKSFSSPDNLSNSSKIALITNTEVNGNTLATFSPRISAVPLIYKNDYAFYKKINKEGFKIPEWRACIAEYNFSQRYHYLKGLCNNMLLTKEASTEQVTVYLKRLESLKLAYVHTAVIEKLEEKNGYVTYMYNVITTSNKKVHYGDGGPNEFKPIFLCEDEKTGNKFYTISLTYYNKITVGEYLDLINHKPTLELKDSMTLQKLITEILIRVSRENTFQAFDVKKDCIEKAIIEINPEEAFPIKNTEHEFKPFHSLLDIN